jgi:hypothetical protein
MGFAVPLHFAQGAFGNPERVTCRTKKVKGGEKKARAAIFLGIVFRVVML